MKGSPTQARQRWPLALQAALLLFAPPLSAQSSDGLERVQEIKGAERFALQLLIDQCEHGVSPWVEALASDSPLQADPGLVAAEIELRLGPGCHGSWELWTPDAKNENQVALSVEWDTGFDDLLLIDFDPASQPGTNPRLHNLRSLADMGFADGATSDGSAAMTRIDSLEPGLPGQAVAIGLAISILLLGATFSLRGVPHSNRRLSPRRVTLSVPLTLLLLIAGCLGQTEEPGDPLTATSVDTPTASYAEQLSHMVELRSALTQVDAAARDRLFGQELEDLRLDQMRRLWEAQWLLDTSGDRRIDAVLAQLENIETPAAHLIRARAHSLRRNGDEAMVQYQTAFSALPWVDGLRLEAAHVLETLGFTTRTRNLLRSLAKRGSRQPEVYYELAGYRLIDGNLTAAEGHFETAWALGPKSRQEILESGLLSYLLEPSRPIHGLLDLDQFEEPWIATYRQSGLEPLLLPSSAIAMVEGEHLHIELQHPTHDGRRTLSIPGGVSIVDPSVERVPAGTWRAARTDAALERLDELSLLARSPTSLARVRVQDDLRAAAERLGREYRWRELASLTNGIEEHVRWVDPEVARLRATALDQLGDTRRSTRLLAKLVKDIVERDRYDPGTLVELSNILSTTYDRHDIAIKLLKKANAQVKQPIADGRIRQLELEKRLAAEFQVLETEHFLVHYPAGREELIDRMGKVLEAEYLRLRQWIPVEFEERVEVHVMAFEEFSDLYGGRVEVLGIYDGRIRVPLANAWGFHPFLVSLLSHELAHAMIAEMTDNQVPKWVHEGLAQLVEMVPARVNPMADYKRTDRLLSFPMIEAVLRGFPNQALVATAYDEAFWTLAYIQDQHGIREIPKLLVEFQKGRSSEEALEAVLGMSAEEFDRALEDWWLNEAPRQWTTEVHRYETYTDPYARRAGKNAGRQLETRWWQ